MPQRFLRPGITTSDRWNGCSFEAQSFYIRLLTLVDDYGRFDARVPIIHAYCFALRPDITAAQTGLLRNELHDAKLIQVYTHEGKEFLQFTNWQERARGQSRFPAPDSNPQESAAECGRILPPSPSSSPSPAGRANKEKSSLSSHKLRTTRNPIID